GRAQRASVHAGSEPHMSNDQPAIRDQRGFSMSELLVVSALLSIVMARVLSLLMVGKQSATTTSNKVDAQANARIGIERMIEEIREAGYLPAGDRERVA